MTDYRNKLIEAATTDPRDTFTDGVWKLRDKEQGVSLPSSKKGWPLKSAETNVLDFRNGRPII